MGPLSGNGLGRSALHRVSARTKLIGLVVFVVIVVATPREWFPAFALYAALIATVLIVARVSPVMILRRSLIEVPFLVFALLMPFIAQGPRTQVLGLSLSIAGLWGAWGLLVKATLAVLASIALVSTTEPRRIVLALESFRLPRELVSIMAFMLRYLDLIVDESARMRTARTARGFTPTGPRSWRIIGSGVGALFVRSHARGERVHLAMLSRGYAEVREP
ncbi:cobalt ABC transporter permease [Agromyces aureus]|uniref:Cobalt ABC transporter permease n=1 Tax=Agromyces aureus TaxID=453304 RepID=A0A191WL11_9MICO|nr:cobalt ABC transporter permease [Agromyces aureus]